MKAVRPFSPPAAARSMAGLLALAALLQPALAAEPACILSLSTPQLDMGRVAPAELNRQARADAMISLGKRTTSLNVACNAPANFAIRFRAPAATATTHAINSAPGAATVQLTLSQAQADGKPASWLSAFDSQRNGDKIVLAPGDSIRAAVGGVPVAVAQLSATVESDMLIDARHLKSGADRDLGGAGQFELVRF